MDQTDKLQALVQKAIDAGLKNAGSLSLNGWLTVLRDHPNEVDFFQLIFNHDFAKALFGQEDYIYELPAWKHHLQQAVINNDPISYMYEVVFSK